MSGRIAAFFDLDGTLMPLPSLERRFSRMLRDRREIPLKNYSLWLREALQLLPHGIRAVAQANKMYLSNVQSFDESGTANLSDFSGRERGRPSQFRASQDEGQAWPPSRHNPRWPVPCFFEEAVERLTCHAMLGHRMVIVSGTLEPLANAAARALEAEIAAHGFVSNIHVCATRLEEMNGIWTGQILGEPMFGEAKVRAVRTLAEEMNLDLSQSWGYGDSVQDRWLLATVGHPTAVNPSRNLARLAGKRGWAVLRWRAAKDLTASSQNVQRNREQRDKREDLREAEATEPLLKSQEIQDKFTHAERCA